MTGANRISPILSWALLFALIAALWTGVVAPLQDWSGEAARQLDRQRQILFRQTTLLGGAEAIETARAEAVEAEGRWDILRSGSDGAVQSAFQAQLRELASAAGVALTRLQVGEVETEELYRRHALRIDGDGSLEQIQSLLIALSNARPVILVEEVSIRTVSAEGPLRLSLDLRALSAKEH
ncbi:type II secretion system protein GspM [Nisaea sediminum]|uniref:type II secretion system protein GspM n=1 Tax=Nisaea sediminum TaxID=2775867 RepID=UPI001867852C|nr:type II secretion system protein GspM [Nisaea sediminum]